MPDFLASSTMLAMFSRLREIEIPAAGSEFGRAMTSRFSVSVLNLPQPLALTRCQLGRLFISTKVS